MAQVTIAQSVEDTAGANPQLTGVTSGRVLVLVAKLGRYFGVAPTVSSVSGGSGGTWSSARTNATQSEVGTFIFECVGNTASTVTISISGTFDEAACTLYELIYGDAFDVAAQGNGASGTTQATSATGTLASDECLAIAGVCSETGFSSYTPNGGFTEDADNSSGYTTSSSHLEVTGTSGVTGSFTCTTSAPWAAGIIVIKPAAGGFSASGTPSLPFFNAAGTAVQTHSASGAPNLPKLNAAGQAVMLPSATGTPSLPFINTAGVAVHRQSATGTPSLPFLNASGVAVTGAYSATGTPSLPFFNVSGVAVHTQAATGTPSLPFLSAAGSAVMLPSATGAPSLPFLSTAGSALHTQAASGAPALPFFNVSGVAVFGSAATASGTPSLPFINTTGTALQTQSASGTPSLPFLSAAGSAIFGSAVAATGTPSLPFMAAAGVAAQTHAATGAPSLPFLSASGAAVQIPKATGTPSLPFMTATGAAAITYTATGAANLPRLGAAGSAFFGDALGVIATALARWSPVVSANARYARDATASARNE